MDQPPRRKWTTLDPEPASRTAPLRLGFRVHFRLGCANDSEPASRTAPLARVRLGFRLGCADEWEGVEIVRQRLAQTRISAAFRVSEAALSAAALLALGSDCLHPPLRLPPRSIGHSAATAPQGCGRSRLWPVFAVADRVLRCKAWRAARKGCIFCFRVEKFRPSLNRPRQIRALAGFYRFTSVNSIA
jgi:hypothetical protein